MTTGDGIRPEGELNDDELDNLLLAATHELDEHVARATDPIHALLKLMADSDEMPASPPPEALLGDSDAEQSLYATQIIFARPVPGDPDDPVTWPAYSELVPHVLAAVHSPVARGVSTESEHFRAKLLNVIRYLVASEQYSYGESLGRATYSHWARVFGENHPDTIASAHHLAIALHRANKDEAARTLVQKVVERRRSTLGFDHPDTISSTDLLGIVLYALGDCTAAKFMHAANLERSRRVFGPDHPQTLTSVGNLAVAQYDAQYELDEYAAVRRLDGQTPERRLQVLGPDHPDTLTSADNLAIFDHAAEQEHTTARLTALEQGHNSGVVATKRWSQEEASPPSRPQLIDADARIVERVRQAGEGSREYLELSTILLEIGVGTLTNLRKNNSLFPTLRQHRIAVPKPPESWPKDAPGVIYLSVRGTVPNFMRRQVLDGGWDPNKGTTLKTFFVTASLYGFAKEYRTYYKEETGGQRMEYCVDDVALLVDHDQEYEAASLESAAVHRDTLRRLLPPDTDPELLIILVRASQHFTQKEIADNLGVSEEAVSSRIRRFRRRGRQQHRE
jgi:hypothetical protein